MTRGVFSESFPEFRVAILSILDFWHKQFGAFVKTAFYERWGSFWKKKTLFRNFFSMFFGFGSNIFWNFNKKILVGWPKCRWKSLAEHFEDNVFFKKNSSFSDFETKTFGKGQNFSVAFSKLHNTWPQKHSKEKFSEVWGPIFCQFRTFSKNNSERLSKLLSMSPEDRFGKENYFLNIEIFFHDFST